MAIGGTGFTNLEEFNQELRDATAGLIKEDFVVFRNKLAFELFRRIVLKTPVDTGRARANWQLTIRTPAKGTKKKTSKTGQEPIAKAASTLNDHQSFDTVWIANNLNYISFLEEGHSRQQAPRGMVALSVEEVRQSFSR